MTKPNRRNPNCKICGCKKPDQPTCTGCPVPTAIILSGSFFGASCSPSTFDGTYVLDGLWQPLAFGPTGCFVLSADFPFPDNGFFVSTGCNDFGNGNKSVRVENLAITQPLGTQSDRKYEFLLATDAEDPPFNISVNHLYELYIPFADGCPSGTLDIPFISSGPNDNGIIPPASVRLVFP